MANNLEVNRSIQFVSLDTHPANNALVVTYEISVQVLDQLGHREVSRRSKRDQLQISISALDNLTEKDLKADKLVVNLQELSADIVRKCPLLLSERNNLEDIQLHLLYLIGRRQSQLLFQRLAANSAGEQLGQAGARPASSASSGRLVRPGQSAANQVGRANSRYGTAGARKGATSASGGTRSRSGSSPAQHGDLSDYGDQVDHNASGGDVYGYLHAKETSAGANGHLLDMLEPMEDYMEKFDEHLMKMEDSLEPVAKSLGEFYRAQRAGQACDLESCLEGLYGDDREKLISMSIIRHLTREQANLAGIASNRLLVCAMLRTLRDSSAPTALAAAATSTIETISLSESIFYCLIRFTSFEDVYVRVFVEGDPIDLVKVITDLLVDHMKASPTSANELKMLLDRHYYTNSLLIILMNLIRIDANQSLPAASNRQHKHILSLQQQHRGSRLLGALDDLLQLAAKYLAKDIRLLSKPERITSLLSRVIFALRQLCIFKEFVAQLRARQGFVEATINLISALQLSRTGSGAPTESQSAGRANSSGDKRTLNELYELEISLLKLVNNLILDHKFRTRLVKRNLLKCVLRNLVVFLASRKTNTLSPFQRSSVLLVPFRSLYELSCDEPVKGELYKSKIIMRCLLEYLLSATIDLKQALELLLRQQQQAVGHNASTSRRGSAATTLAKQQSPVFPRQPQATLANSASSRNSQPIDDQIVVCLEPESRTAAHYIVSLWVNLSSRRAAAIYSDDPELREFIGEYIELTISNLRAYLAIGQHQRQQPQTMHQMMTLKTAKSSSSQIINNQQSSVAGSVGSASERLSPVEITIYLHLKLLRNLTQFLALKQSPELAALMLEASCSKWVELVGQATNELLELSETRCCLSPLVVECLSSLGHLISLGHQQQKQEDIDSWQQEQEAKRAPTMPSPQQIGPLLERLFALVNQNGSSGDHFEAENDDLLLVSVLFLGTLASNFEVCQQLTGSINLSKLILACNFILETKSIDRELIIASLCTLSQLLNHSAFLNDLSDSLFCLEGTSSNRQQQQEAQSSALSAGQLVDKLAGLMLSGDIQIAWLAVTLLSRLRQLEEQRSLESSIYKKRFVAYNEKWLNAIRASREELLLVDGDSGGRQQATAISNGSNDNHSSTADENLTIEELSQLRAVENEASAVVGQPTPGSPRPKTGQERRQEADRADLCADEDDDDDDENDDDDEASLAAPDLNVIDANSMIKHLTSRRQFRSEWLRK